MIRSIKIQNFQSHENTKLEFCNGVNIIVGPSDSGKTAILRALNWLVNNRPMGDDFRSNWGGDTLVRLETDMDLVIDRIKSDKDNCYILHTDEEEIDFKAAGRDVPEDIKQILNLDPINLQFQLDGPFLLSKSAGEVAKYLNQIIKLDSIDSSLSSVNRRIKNQAGEIANFQTNLSSLKDELEEFVWIEKAEAELENLESLDRDCGWLAEEIDHINRTLKQIESVNEEIEEFKLLTRMEKEVENLSSLINEIEQDKEHLLKLSDLVDSITELSTWIGKEKCGIEIFQENYDELMPDKCPLCGRGD